MTKSILSSDFATTTSAPTSDHGRDSRQNPRSRVRIRAHLHFGETCQATTITDLSLDGAGLDGAIGVAPGDAIELELINGRRLSGHIIWRLMGCCGIQFAEPLRLDDPVFHQAPSDPR